MLMAFVGEESWPDCGRLFERPDARCRESTLRHLASGT